MPVKKVASKGLIEEEGEGRSRPVSGSVESLFGFLRRPGAPSHSVEEIDEEIARVVVLDDERVVAGHYEEAPETEILELAVPVPDELKAELDRRLAEFEANPEAGLPWEEVRGRIVQGRWRTG